MMNDIPFNIREYTPEDLVQAADVIHKTAKRFKPSDGTPEAICEYVNFYAPHPENIERIKENFALTPIFLVAREKEEIIGIIRGAGNRISNFFVLPGHQHIGIGRALFVKFEEKCCENGETRLKARAAISSIPVYKCLGFKKATGVRNRAGLNVQPMIKYCNT
jgi:GNAT superfamily N-acetyltransferase